MSHDEIFAVGYGRPPQGVFLKHVGWLDAPITIMPLPGGIEDNRLCDTSDMITAYLKHGMVLRAYMTLADHGAGLCVKDIITFSALGGAADSALKVPPDEKVQLKAVQDFARELAAYRNARMNAGLKIEIKDWQGEERADKTTPESVRILIERAEDRLSLSTRDGRKVDLELQDGDLRVLAFESEDGKESPVLTILPREGDILTERSDYDREARPAEDFGPPFPE